MQIVKIIDGVLHFKDVEIKDPENKKFPERFIDFNEYELFEERAAIAQYDGGLIREQAERLAWESVIFKRQLLN